MKKKTAIIGSTAAAGVLLVGGVTAVSATGQPGFTGGERDDQPLTGSTLDKARDAATDAAGGGKVTETEHSDDRGVAYEIEVTLPNGDEVDVDLDSDYNVVNKETDKADGDDRGDDDRGDMDDRHD
ncbi:MAG TPA: hypothetical protein VK059_10575, partial [Nocardioidaceae bacterium]|nr:hypothetical protein [Nocardioidaceae bacterium]